MIERGRSRRGLAIVGGLVLAGFLLAGCPLASPDGPRARRAADHAPPRLAGLLYQQGARLHLRNVTTGAQRVLARLPSEDVYASPGSTRLAVVAPGPRGQRNPDFTSDPRLFLLDAASGESAKVGAGHSPLPHSSGRYIAFLEPVGERSCEAERCSGAARIVTLDSASGRRRRLLPPGRWGLLAWAGERLLVSNEENSSVTATVSLDGSRTLLPVAPRWVWDASPDGRWLVVVRGRRARLRSLSAGRFDGRGHVLVLDGLLADGAWAPDSGRAAAVLLASDERRSRVVILNPQQRALRPLVGSEGAVGNLVWSRDSRAVAFVAVGPTQRRLSAMYCRVQQAEPCRRLFSWERGVLLLRLE